MQNLPRCDSRPKVVQVARLRGRYVRAAGGGVPVDDRCSDGVGGDRPSAGDLNR